MTDAYLVTFSRIDENDTTKPETLKVYLDDLDPELPTPYGVVLKASSDFYWRTFTDGFPVYLKSGYISALKEIGWYLSEFKHIKDSPHGTGEIPCGP